MGVLNKGLSTPQWQKPSNLLTVGVLNKEMLNKGRGQKPYTVYIRSRLHTTHCQETKYRI